MLSNLHVKNLALIDEADVAFGPGLNVLTGETGAGKSILLGSIDLALGGKAGPSVIRAGADTAVVELMFTQDDTIISRKIGTRSYSRINGETVSAAEVRELADTLINIHGQHEHETLLHKRKHQAILDAYAGDTLAQALERTSSLYQALASNKRELSGVEESAANRARELDLARFEYDEIEQAAVRIGEDDELEAAYARMKSANRIRTDIGITYESISGDSGALDSAGTALQHIRAAMAHDSSLTSMESELADAEALLQDCSRELSDYIDGLDVDEGAMSETEARLDTLNRLKSKHGGTLEAVLAYGASMAERIDELEHIDERRDELILQASRLQSELLTACEEASGIRKEAASRLEQELTEALLELNFLSVDFRISIRHKEPAADGYDDIEFLISTNPGVEPAALGEVASGGELSRVMLGIKTVMAGKLGVETVIFDEIDAGISGKTAWKVAAQLGKLSRTTQVICITHLAQIAAMADTHLLIEKSATDGQTTTTIRELDANGQIAELARMLGGDADSPAAIENARELKRSAFDAAHRETPCE